MSDPNPDRWYVATQGYVSKATQQHLPPPGVARQGLKLRGDHPVVLEHPEFWIDAADDPETAALAQVTADALRRTASAPVPALGIELRPTREEVEAEIARRKADDLPAGYGSVAKALGVSRNTIRRRLGKDD